MTKDKQQPDEEYLERILADWRRAKLAFVECFLIGMLFASAILIARTLLGDS